MTYRKMDNVELIDLLFTAEDNLPRSAANEIVRRADELTHELGEIAMDRLVWTADLPDWWAPIHATYLMGVIGTEAVITPLLASLKWSDAYDNEWVTEDLPSIMGSLGDISYGALKAAAQDRSAGWSARSIAMDGLGSQALRFPRKEEEVVGLLGAMLTDRTEEHGARRAAAFVLIDFRRVDFKDGLLELAADEVRRQHEDPSYKPAFTPDGLERDLSSQRIALDAYIRDWLLFYTAEEISRRQERWDREDGRVRHKRSCLSKLH